MFTRVAIAQQAAALALLLHLAGGCGRITLDSLGANLTPNTGGSEDDNDSPAIPTDNDPVVPANEYCAAVSAWSAEAMQLEQQVLELVNQNRAAGADCGSAGSFAAAAPLAMNEALRCAARNHSLDMSVRDFFDHTNPDGEGPRERIDRTGYDGFTWGENIAWGYPTAEAVMAGWMSSPGHCANIMRGSFTEIGVGHYEGAFWTLTFGAR